MNVSLYRTSKSKRDAIVDSLHGSIAFSFYRGRPYESS